MNQLEKLKNNEQVKKLTKKSEKYKTFLKSKVAPHITKKLGEYMVEFCLSPKAFDATLDEIEKNTFDNLHPHSTPTVYIVIGQPGAGKSIVSRTILKQNPNTFHIDSDNYKKYNPLTPLIAQFAPTHLGHLTGIDSYSHQTILFDKAIENRYNILIEVAPSTSDYFFNINLEELEKQNYKIVFHFLAVSLPNSLVSIHERFERQLKNKELLAKLTDLKRATDSYNAMPLVLEFALNLDKKIHIWKRLNNSNEKKYKFKIVKTKYGQNDKNTIQTTKKNGKTPEKIEKTRKSFEKTLKTFAKIQKSDAKSIRKTLSRRLTALKNSMQSRKAPQKQLTQLKEVEKMIREMID